MKTARFLWVVFGFILCFGLIAYAPVAQAGEGSAAAESGAQFDGVLMVKIQRSYWGNYPVSVVVYDRDWKPVAGAELSGETHRFAGLKIGDYHVAAESDYSEASQVEDVPIFAQKVTEVSLQLQRPERPNAAGAAGLGARRACRAGAGAAGSYPIFPSYGETIIYMQCGRIVGKVLPMGCGCSAGNWRYTTDCVKSAPIYINLPCPGR